MWRVLLSLLPTLIVALILLPHGVIFWRLFTTHSVEDDVEGR